MAITGDAETAPLRVGYPLADSIGGLTAAMTIAAALNAPERGSFIDVSMLEATVATMGWVVSNYLIAGVTPTANGNENLTSAPSGTFRTADGPINIAANKDEQWQALAQHLGRADLLSHPDYLTRELRKKNRIALREALEETLITRPAAAWEGELNALGVPAGAVLTVEQVLASPQIAGRGMLASFPAPEGVGRDITVVRMGARLDGQTPSVSAPPPMLGADNAAIYGQVGVDAEELARLREEGVI